jgi:hypothetical protein
VSVQSLFHIAAITVQDIFLRRDGFLLPVCHCKGDFPEAVSTRTGESLFIPDRHGHYYKVK